MGLKYPIHTRFSVAQFSVVIYVEISRDEALIFRDPYHGFPSDVLLAKLAVLLSD